MKFLRRPDFVLSANIASVESPIATYTCPQSQFVQLLSGTPFYLYITAYTTTTLATAGAAFSVTPQYLVQPVVSPQGTNIVTSTAIAYDLTLKTAPPVYPTSISGNTINFPAISGSAANDTIGVWYLVGTGTYTIYVQAGKTTKKSYTIASGSLMLLNSLDQFYSKTQLLLPENAPLAPGDQLIISVNTPATISMTTLQTIPAANFPYELDTPAMIEFPVEITNQPGS